MKQLLAECILLLILGIGAWIWLAPGTAEPAIAPLYVQEPSLVDYALGFSKFVLALAPALLILSGPVLAWCYMRNRHEIERIRAARPFEGSSHVTYSPRYPARITEVPPAAMIEDVTPALPGTIDMVQVLDTWQPSPSAILLGLGPGGQPLTAPIKSLCYTALAGPTGNGKSNLLRLLLAQLLATNAQVVLCDPHYADIDPETGDDWRPIRTRLLMEPATTSSDIRHVMLYFVQELEQRLARRRAGEHPGGPLFLAADEWPSIAAAVKEAPEALGRILREGRKVNLLIVSSAHDMLVRTFKSDTGAVRECFKTAFYLGGDQHTGRVLLDMQGRIDDGALGAGLAYLRSSAAPAAQLVRLPLASNEALYQLLNQAHVSQLEAAHVSQNNAFQSPIAYTPEEERIISLFQQGYDVSDVVKAVYNVASNEGRKYQDKSRAVQAVLRKQCQAR